MKKVLFLVIAISGVIALSSCNSEKSCKCTITAKATGIDPIVTTAATTIKKGKCSDLNDKQTTTVAGVTVVATTECK